MEIIGLNNATKIKLVPSINKTHSLFDRNVESQLSALVKREIARKKQIAIQKGHKFTDGDMLNVEKISFDGENLILHYSYWQYGYYQHWLTTHNLNVYNYLKKNKLITRFKFNGLAVCILVVTEDGKCVLGKSSAHGNGAFSTGVVNVCGGNFQLSELYPNIQFSNSECLYITENDLYKLAQLELAEELGLHVQTQNLVPLVYANSSMYKANPTLVFQYNFNGKLIDLQKEISIGNDEFIEVVYVDSRIYADMKQTMNFSFGAKVALDESFSDLDSKVVSKQFLTKMA